MQYVTPSVTSDPSTDPAVTSRRLLVQAEAVVALPQHAQQADVQVVVAAVAVALADLFIITAMFLPSQNDAEGISCCGVFVARAVLLCVVLLVVVGGGASTDDYLLSHARSSSKELLLDLLWPSLAVPDRSRAEREKENHLLGKFSLDIVLYT